MSRSRSWRQGSSCRKLRSTPTTSPLKRGVIDCRRRLGGHAGSSTPWGCEGWAARRHRGRASLPAINLRWWAANRRAPSNGSVWRRRTIGDPAMRLYPLLVSVALTACAHAPASDPNAKATSACLRIATRNGAAIGGPPDQDTVVMGPSSMLGEKTWSATPSRGEVVCTLRDRQVQSVTVARKEVWARR